MQPKHGPITGTLIMMGGLPPNNLPYRKDGAPAGLLIRVDPSAASQVDLLPPPYSVEVWPACADDLAPGECTPENYAHLKQRLAVAADNLAREVRSNQAAALVRADLERRLSDAQAESHIWKSANSSMEAENERLVAELVEANNDAHELRRRIAFMNEGCDGNTKDDEPQSEPDPYPG